MSPSSQVRSYIERMCAKGRGEFVSTDAEISVGTTCSLSTVRRTVSNLVTDGHLKVVRRKTKPTTYCSIKCSKEHSNGHKIECSPEHSNGEQTRVNSIFLPSLPTKKEDKTRTREKPTPSMVPLGWHPDDVGVAYAKQRGVPRSEVEAFVDYHRKKGSVFADIGAAWRTWCRNHVAFRERDKRKDQPAPTRPTVFPNEPSAQVAKRIDL